MNTVIRNLWPAFRRAGRRLRRSLLLVMVVLVTADILLRNITRTGFPWANEVSEYALYAMTLLAAPWLLRRGQHVRIDSCCRWCRRASPG